MQRMNFDLRTQILQNFTFFDNIRLKCYITHIQLKQYLALDIYLYAHKYVNVMFLKLILNSSKLNKKIYIFCYIRRISFQIPM